MATSSGVKVTRKEYGHAGRVWGRTTFDPGTCAAGYLQSKRSGTWHSRRSWRNMIPAPIVATETQLAQKALSSCGQDYGMFEENLEAFIQRAGELQAYYGSRTWRNIRFNRASRTRGLLPPKTPRQLPPQTSEMTWRDGLIQKGKVLEVGGGR